MAEVARARTAVAVVFIANGVAFASIFARTPALRDGFGLSPAQLGLLLLCLSGGAVAGLPLSGFLVQRLGPARSVVVAAMVSASGMAVLSGALVGGSVFGAAAALVLVGLGTGVWDVAMNLEGAAVEQLLARPLMPRLHAGFSIGAVGGAGIAAACAALGVPFAVQLLGVGAVVLAVVLTTVRSFLPVVVKPEGGPAGGGVLAAWREPRTLLVGVMVLGFAFTEGTANDWLAIALVDGHGASQAVGAAGFGLFVAAMTAARLFGAGLLTRFGRVAVLRTGAVVAAAGLLVVVLGDGLGWALAGAVLWGMGAALGFPVGMSAGADDPARAAARVSVVSSVGYTAFVAGPPLVGLLAEHDGVLRALLVVLAALLLALLTAGATRHTQSTG